MKRRALFTKTRRLKLPVELAARVQALAEWFEDPENAKAYFARLEEKDKAKSHARAQARRKQFRVLAGSTEKRRTP